MSGNDGNDTIDGDSVSGGLGVDSLFGGADAGDRLIEQVSGTITLTASSLRGLETDVLSGFEAASLTGSGGNDTRAGVELCLDAIGRRQCLHEKPILGK